MYHEEAKPKLRELVHLFKRNVEMKRSRLARQLFELDLGSTDMAMCLGMSLSTLRWKVLSYEDLDDEMYALSQEGCRTPDIHEYVDGRMSDGSVPAQEGAHIMI